MDVSNLAITRKIQDAITDEKVRIAYDLQRATEGRYDEAMVRNLVTDLAPIIASLAATTAMKHYGGWAG